MNTIHFSDIIGYYSIIHRFIRIQENIEDRNIFIVLCHKKVAKLG